MQALTTINNDLDFIGRQLSQLGTKEDFDLNSALKQLAEVNNGELRSAVDLLQNSLQGNSLLPGSVLGTLVEFFTVAKPPADKAGEVIHLFYKIQRRLYDDVKAYLFSLRNTFTYLSILLAFTVSIYLINLYKVLPTYADNFNDYGAPLPSFTLFMMGPGKAIIWIVFFIVATLLYCAFWGAVKVNQHIRELKIIPVKPLWAWIARDMLLAINSNITLIYLYIGLRAGNDFDTAKKLTVDLIKRSTNTDNLRNYLDGDLHNKLTICADLQTCQGEIDYQLQIAAEKLIGQVVTFRTLLNISLHILMVLVIGAMVVSFYLPIFQLGQVV